jgi:hypothetical protein
MSANLPRSATIKETPMKKLLICLLLLPSLAWGQEYARMNPYILGSSVPVAAVTYCTSATECGTNHCDLLCEDFEGATDCGDVSTIEKCRTTYDETIATDDTIAFNNTPYAGLTCTSGNNQNMKINYSAINHVTTAKFAFSSSLSVFGGRFYVLFAAMPEASKIPQFFVIENSSNQTTLIFSVFGHATTPRFRTTYFNTAGSSATVDDADITVAANTWYQINFIYNATAGTLLAKAQAIGGTEYTIADVSDVKSDRAGKNVYIGNRAASSATPYLSPEYKNIRLDSTQVPEACE